MERRGGGGGGYSREVNEEGEGWGDLRLLRCSFDGPLVKLPAHVQTVTGADAGLRTWSWTIWGLAFLTRGLALVGLFDQG